MRLFGVLCVLLLTSDVRADTFNTVCVNPLSGVSIVGMQSCRISGPDQITMSVTVVVPKLGEGAAVYRLVQNLAGGAGSLVMVEAGVAMSSVACDPKQQIRLSDVDYYRVPRTVVSFNGNNRPATVWAKCT